MEYLFPSTAKMLADGIEKLLVPPSLCSAERYKRNLIDNTERLLEHIYNSGYKLVKQEVIEYDGKRISET